MTVVQYLNSSPNHNNVPAATVTTLLFNISIHHQTTTSELHLIRCTCCSISQFITKPQPAKFWAIQTIVVQYLNSSPNHNYGSELLHVVGVVQYLNSSPNHNYLFALRSWPNVVQYLNSSPNHNHINDDNDECPVVQYLNSSPNHN